ncbi:GNAT family N-acetyltransferase [Candidatus Thorarchaeota archaeon]|nr:MAG: GNAT family N-acetyltransferase [Candidatus Thorarchaeota archaeon]
MRPRTLSQCSFEKSIYARINRLLWRAAMTLIETCEDDFTPCLDSWDQVRKEFYADAPWMLSCTYKNAMDLLQRETSTLAVIARDGERPVCIGSLERIPSSAVMKISELAFLKDEEDAGREVLERLIERAHDLKAATLSVWIPESNERLRALLQERGLEKSMEEGVFHLYLASSATQETPWFTISSLAEGFSIEEFVTANRTAFAEDESRLLEEAEVREWIGQGERFDPELQLVAVHGGDAIGTVLCELSPNSIREDGPSDAWVYGLGVVPAHRRRGVARTLIEELKRRLKKRNILDLYLLSDVEGGARPFYESAGFTMADVYAEYSFSLEPGND